MLFVNTEKIISAQLTKRACILQRQALKVPTFIWKATPTFWFKLGKSQSKTNEGGKGGRVIPDLLRQSLREILLPGRKWGMESYPSAMLLVGSLGRSGPGPSWRQQEAFSTKVLLHMVTLLPRWT